MRMLPVLMWAILVSHGYGSPTPVVYDTIVVGLGASGSAAASVLAQAGKKVLALEAQNRVGGRVYTAPFGDGIVELGAEWIHGTDNSSTYELAIKNNVTILEQVGGVDVYYSDRSTGREDLVKNLSLVALEVVDTLPLTEPESLGHYISRRIRDYVLEKYPSVANDTAFVDSVLEFLDFFIITYEAADTWDDITTQSRYDELGGSQDMSWHTHGYKTLFEIILNTYKGGPGYPTLESKLDTEVTRIQYPHDPHDNVRVTVNDGTTYTARNVIVTLSVGVLKERYKTLFSPPLPEQKVRAIEGISLGVCDKMVFRFEEPWWPADNLGFFIWRPEDKASVPDEDKWLLGVNTPSTPLSYPNAFTIWTCGEAARKMESLPVEVVSTKVMSLLRRFMGANITIPEPLELVRTSWYSNPFTRGSYSYDNVNTPQHPTARADLAQPITDSAGKPRVLFAGEATETNRYATVHGAVDSGRREANRLLSSAS